MTGNNPRHKGSQLTDFTALVRNKKSPPNPWTWRGYKIGWWRIKRQTEFLSLFIWHSNTIMFLAQTLSLFRVLNGRFFSVLLNSPWYVREPEKHIKTLQPVVYGSNPDSDREWRKRITSNMNEVSTSRDRNMQNHLPGAWPEIIWADDGCFDNLILAWRESPLYFALSAARLIYIPTGL